MKKTIRRTITLIVMVLAMAQTCDAFSLALDSVRTWGKFPRFCVDTYRWGDKFFNSYDSAYVVGTGTKFNVKVRTESWVDYYNFNLPGNVRMRMTSDPSTATGIWLTYLAVTVGYDVNVSQLFGFNNRSRSRFSFGFNCSLFAADMYIEENDGGARINRFGKRGSVSDPDIEFHGINTSSWGIDTYYFFNHKKYSQAAAFAFSKLQKRSQGSFYAGLSIYTHRYHFDFTELPEYMQQVFPQDWIENGYYAKNHNFSFRIGYGYNLVLGKHWTIGISAAPSIGLRKGYLNNTEEKYSFGVAGWFKGAVVWNNDRWFAGATGLIDGNLIYDRTHTFTTAYINGTLSVGYRFNIW